MAVAVVRESNCAPIQGKIVVPRELKACVRFKRFEAVCGFPSTAHMDLPQLENRMPVARMINAARKTGTKESCRRKKARQATTIVSSPALWLSISIQSIIFAAE